jgi:hypothetical protein
MEDNNKFSPKIEAKCFKKIYKSLREIPAPLKLDIEFVTDGDTGIVVTDGDTGLAIFTRI